MGMFRTWDNKGTDWVLVSLVIMLVFFMIFIIIGVIYLFVDIAYVAPVADTNANNYCKSLGFDQYKSYSRVGLWSENPVGIKCEFAERYTDLGVRINI